MNELMVFIEQYEAQKANAIAERVERGIDDAVGWRAQLTEEQARAEDLWIEAEIEQYYQAKGDLEAEEFEL